MIPIVRITFKNLQGWVIDTNRDSTGNVYLVVVLEDGSFTEVQMTEATVTMTPAWWN